MNTLPAGGDTAGCAVAPLNVTTVGAADHSAVNPVLINKTTENVKTISQAANQCADVADGGTELEEVNYIGGEASIMGSKPEATMSPISRRAARKQRRWRKHLDLKTASNEVYRLHNLIQYDHDEPEGYSPELHELALMRAQLVRLALLTCL